MKGLPSKLLCYVTAVLSDIVSLASKCDRSADFLSLFVRCQYYSHVGIDTCHIAIDYSLHGVACRTHSLSLCIKVAWPNLAIRFKVAIAVRRLRLA